MSSAWWRVDWVWTATGWSLGVVGLTLLAWALCWDRARGRRRCPGCWYDMSGAVRVEETSRDREGAASSGGALCVCPECGKKIGRERELGRVRRRWGWAWVTSVILLVAVQVHEQPRRRMERWTNWIPTTLLVMVADLDAVPQTNDLSDALWHRGSSLWFWQGAVVVFREHVPAVEELQATVVSRRMWPADEKVLVRIVAPAALRPIVGAQTLRAYVREGDVGAGIESRVDAPDIGFVCRMGVRDFSGAALSLGIGRHTLVVKGELESEAGDFSWVVRRWTQTLDVEVVAALDEVVHGQTTPAMEARIQSGFIACAETGCTFMAWWSPEPYEPPPGGIRLTLLRDGEELASQTIRDGSTFLCWDAVRDATTWTKELPPPDLLKRLTLRISGDARTTLPQMDQDWYWSGSVDVPVQELLDRREAQRAKRK